MYHPPPHPMDEEERLEALKKYRILDTDPEPQFDRVADMARRQFGMPIGFVAFMDSDRNFLKARGAMPMSEAPRDISFCGHAILDDKVLVIPDASADERFAENPVVTGDFHIRFYAGAPLITPDGHRIGTVCVFDTKPRDDFGEAEKAKLKDLAAIVTDHLEMRLLIGKVHDEIETRRLAEAEARHLALYDVLTDLPNRAYLEKVIAEGPPFKVHGVLAALSTDLDHFKAINDALGHHAGDELLQRVAKAIKDTVGERAFVARVSGDEFAVLLDGESREAVEAIAAELVDKTREPVVLRGHTLPVGFSIGVAFADNDGDLAALFRRSGLGLFEAKRSGRRRFVTFSEKMQAKAERRRQLQQDLAVALRQRQIAVHYQPIHSASDRALIGVEALARWTHPKLGPISPADFVAVAEETGQILELGRQVFEKAIAEARGWEELFVSVNLSPVQFLLGDLGEEITQKLAEAHFPPERLQLEVTENVLLSDLNAARRQIDALHQLGIGVSLDDFGTGYSSLSYLRTLPFDKVKIDRSFVRGLAEHTTNHAIIRLIVALARELGMKVTAEGVETEEEALLLRAAGCTSFQGYLFGKAMPAAEIEALLHPEVIRATG